MLRKTPAVVDGTKPAPEFPDWSFFNLFFSTTCLPCRSVMSTSLCCKQQQHVGWCHHQWRWCWCWWYKSSSRISWSSGWLGILHLILQHYLFFFFYSLISTSFCCSLSISSIMLLHLKLWYSYFCSRSLQRVSSLLFSALKIAQVTSTSFLLESGVSTYFSNPFINTSFVKLEMCPVKKAPLLPTCQRQ